MFYLFVSGPKVYVPNIFERLRVKGLREIIWESSCIYLVDRSLKKLYFGRGSEGTLCRPYSKYVWWHSCKSFSSSPNQDAAMAAACKWPSCQKQNRLSILIGLLSWINLPYLVSPSKITILKIFTEVLKPKPVTTETVTIDTRTFLEDSSNLYRVALAEKKPRLWSSLAVCAC